MKKILTRTISIALLVALLFVLCACESTEDDIDTTAVNTTNTTSTAKAINYAEAAEKQMAMPQEGEEIAIFHIKDYGDVKVRLFPEYAPKAVENFLTHAKEGYYNGLTFHRIMNEFMIQGGDPEGTGAGGESIWGKYFETELPKELVPYRGSLCMARTQQIDTNGSQFFITQAHYNETVAMQIKASKQFPLSIIDQYKKYGGDLLNLYKQYTVFGQVFEGMEIVDAIAANTPVEDNNGTVLKENQPVIESIEVTAYNQ